MLDYKKHDYFLTHRLNLSKAMEIDSDLAYVCSLYLYFSPSLIEYNSIILFFKLYNSFEVIYIGIRLKEYNFIHIYAFM